MTATVSQYFLRLKGLAVELLVLSEIDLCGEKKHVLVSLSMGIDRYFIFTAQSATQFISGRLCLWMFFVKLLYLQTFRDSKGSLVTQLPLPSTLVDFWRLVYGNDVTTIVSLSSPNEEQEAKVNVCIIHCIIPFGKFGPL